MVNMVNKCQIPTHVEMSVKVANHHVKLVIMLNIVQLVTITCFSMLVLNFVYPNAVQDNIMQILLDK